MYEAVKAWWSFMKRWKTSSPDNKEAWARFVADMNDLDSRIGLALGDNDKKLLEDMLAASAEYFRREEVRRKENKQR